MNVGILFIATGKYIQFFREVYDSFEKYFLKDYKNNTPLFTDSNKRIS